MIVERYQVGRIALQVRSVSGRKYLTMHVDGGVTHIYAKLADDAGQQERQVSRAVDNVTRSMFNMNGGAA